MNFTAEQYYQASQQRLQQAKKLYHHGDSFGSSMYSGGLAVECLLRAFRWREDRSFDGRHDLRELLKASRLFQFNDDLHRYQGSTEAEIDQSRIQLQSAMQEVTTLWRNSLRFASEARTKAYLIEIGRTRGFRGDPIKKNAQDLLEASQTIFDRGVVLWTSEKKSKRR